MDYSKGYFFTKFNVGISYESSKFKIGGALLFRRERIQKMDSIEPAAPKVWPMLLLVAEILILSINLRSFWRSLVIAIASAISPTGVEVAWQFTWSKLSGCNPSSLRAFYIALRAPSPDSYGFVKWYPSELAPYPIISQ